MNPVICVTEFTELTLEAARVAAGFGQHWSERVVLVRSVDEREQFPFPLRSRLVPQDWRRLENEAQRLRQLGFNFEEKVLRGMPEDGIAGFAWNSGARLIVVGSTPTRVLDRWALGSQAEEISATSLVPVLAVRSAAPFERWLEQGVPLNVFVGVDPSERPDAVLNRLDELRELGKCAIVAGFVPYPEVNHSRPEPAPSEYRSHEFGTNRDFAETVSRELAARRIAIRELEAASHGHVEAALTDEASAVEADLLVITSHPRNDLTILPHRCLAKGVLRRAPMSVLCVPESDVEPPRIAPIGRREDTGELTALHPGQRMQPRLPRQR